VLQTGLICRFRTISPIFVCPREGSSRGSREVYTPQLPVGEIGRPRRLGLAARSDPDAREPAGRPDTLELGRATV
jgi:hypothetical protein